MLKRKKYNQPGIIYNPNNIVKIDIIDKKINKSYTYIHDEDFFTKQKRIDNFNRTSPPTRVYTYRAESLKDEYLIIKNKVYYRPKVLIKTIDGKIYTHTFNDINDCYKFVKKLKI